MMLDHIKHSFPYWNRTGGRDHVFVSASLLAHAALREAALLEPAAPRAVLAAGTLPLVTVFSGRVTPLDAVDVGRPRRVPHQRHCMGPN